MFTKISLAAFLALSLMFTCAKTDALKELTKFLKSAVDEKANGLTLAPANILPDLVCSNADLNHHCELARKMKNRLRFYAEPKTATAVEVGVFLDHASSADKGDLSLTLKSNPDSRLLTSHILRSKEHAKIFAPALLLLVADVFAEITSSDTKNSDDLTLAIQLSNKIKNLGNDWKRSRLFDTQQLLDDLRPVADALDFEIEEAKDGVLALHAKSDPEHTWSIKVRLHRSDSQKHSTEYLLVELTYSKGMTSFFNTSEEKIEFGWFLKPSTNLHNSQAALTNALIKLSKITHFALPIEKPEAVLTMTRAMIEATLAKVVKSDDLPLMISKPDQQCQFTAVMAHEGAAVEIDAQLDDKNLPVLIFRNFLGSATFPMSFPWKRFASDQAGFFDYLTKVTSFAFLNERMQQLKPQVEELVYQHFKADQNVFEESVGKKKHELFVDQFSIGKHILLFKSTSDNNQEIPKTQAKTFKRFTQLGLNLEFDNSKMTINIATSSAIATISSKENSISSALEIVTHPDALTLCDPPGKFHSHTAILSMIKVHLNAAVKLMHQATTVPKTEESPKTEMILIV